MTIAIFIWAAIQSFLFGGNILLFKRNKANVFLGLFFVITSINIFAQYISRFTVLKFEVPEILFISDIIGFLYGPVIYLYVRQLIFKDFKFSHYLHFLPALLFAVVFSVHEFIINGPLDFFDYINSTFQRIVLFLIVLSNLIYFMLFNRIVEQHDYRRRSKGDGFIGWLSIFYVFFGMKVITSMIFFSYQAFVQPIYAEEVAIQYRVFTEYAFIIFNAIIIIVTTYWSIKDPFQVYNLSEQSIREIEESTETVQKKVTVVSPGESADEESRFRIPKEEAEVKIEVLNKLIREKKHLDPDLNERAFSEMMDVPLHYLSCLLNEHVGESFTEFINRNRIEDAKQKLLDDTSANLTIFAIALDCGYNSESTFYTNFKKYSGKTPNSFRKEYLK